MTVRSMILAASATLVLFAVQAQALAGSACSSKPMAACQAEPACSWIDAYTRSDGRQVAAYCRSKPAKSVAKAETEGK